MTLHSFKPFLLGIWSPPNSTKCNSHGCDKSNSREKVNFGSHLQVTVHCGEGVTGARAQVCNQESQLLNACLLPTFLSLFVQTRVFCLGNDPPIIKRGLPESVTITKIIPQTFSEAPFNPDNLSQVCLETHPAGEGSNRNHHHTVTRKLTNRGTIVSETNVYSGKNNSVTFPLGDENRD